MGRVTRMDWRGGAGIREVMKSAGMKSATTEQANRIASGAKAQSQSGKSEYGVSSWEGKARAGATAYTANVPAMVANQKRNTLLRAMGGG